MKIKAGIIGAAGYTGGELIRLLLNHPNVTIDFAQSKSNAGVLVSQIHRDLIGETKLQFSASFHTEIDVLFLCSAHGEAKKFLAENKLTNHLVVIDLSNDFRLKANANLGEQTFVYGLPELNKIQIQTSNRIANPGCFATAIQLALLPLAQQQLLNEVYVTGITGSTGAGQSLLTTSHFSWRSNNIQAYKTLTHQHLNEIGETITSLNVHQPEIHFVPWRGDFARGIYISATVQVNQPIEVFLELYKSYYKQAAFTHVSESMIDLKQVINTNKCIIHLEQVNNKLVIHAAIDNLLKGASGQAVQNMNIRFGLPQHTGLTLKATAF
jgi:N-acetyl-gamma-glutamyl-phosphate reductase